MITHISYMVSKTQITSANYESILICACFSRFKERRTILRNDHSC